MKVACEITIIDKRERERVKGKRTTEGRRRRERRQIGAAEINCVGGARIFNIYSQLWSLFLPLC